MVSCRQLRQKLASALPASALSICRGATGRTHLGQLLQPGNTLPQLVAADAGLKPARHVQQLGRDARAAFLLLRVAEGLAVS